MDSFFQDVRYAVRALSKTPSFAAIAVLTIAVGVGATSAIFGIVDNLLFRPPPFTHAQRLVSLIDTNPEKVPPDAETPPSPGNLRDWRERVRAFDAVAAWRNWYYSITDTGAHAGPPSPVRGVRVSPSFFSMLGVDAALGRTFRSEEGKPGRDDVVVLSHALWTRRFGADPGIVGSRVLVDARAHTVIGILPPTFQFYQPDLDLWMPLAEDAGFLNRENHSVLGFARLAPDVSIAQAQSELDAVTRRLAEEHPATNAGWGARIVPLYPSKDVRDVRPALLVLLGAAVLVLLTACVNIANLLLSRAIGRQREMAIRAAVGASRARLIRQMLTEGIVISGASCIAGVIMARWGVHVLVPLLPHADTNQGLGTFGPMLPDINARVLAFTVFVAMASGITFALVPAFQTTRAEFLRVGAPGARRSGMRRGLIAAELSLAIVLVVGAALLLKSFWRLQHVTPGFRSDHLLTMQLVLSKTKYPDVVKVDAFYTQLLQGIEQLPAVRAACAVSFRPFASMAMTTRIDVPGRTPRQTDEMVFAGYDIVTPDYVRTLGQTLVSGRDIAESDGPAAPAVAVINETMARRFWPNEDAIGKEIRPRFSGTDVPWAVDALPRPLTVVGIVSDIKEFRLNEQPRPLMYLSSRQFPSWFMYVMVRTDASPETTSASVQREVAALDPDQPVSNVRTMDDAIAQSVPRFNVELLVLFGGIALLLSTIGVYGVTSYGVSQRTREIGIRMSLGASARDVLMHVLHEAAIVGAVGVVAGLAGAAALGRAMAGMLYGVSPTDVTSLASAAVVLFSGTILAAFVPARRAARVQPMVALRSE